MKGWYYNYTRICIACSRTYPVYSRVGTGNLVLRDYVFPFYPKFGRHCVLSAGTQRRALSRYQSDENGYTHNISFHHIIESTHFVYTITLSVPAPWLASYYNYIIKPVIVKKSAIYFIITSKSCLILLGVITISWFCRRNCIWA